MSAKLQVATCVVALGLLVAGSASGQDAGAIVGWGQKVVVPQSALTDLFAVTGGDGHSLGLKADGSIVAWGYNADGKCNVPSANSGFVGVAGGGHHSLGLRAFYGDLNCDGVVNFDDINAFVVALSGRETYQAAFSRCHWLNADCNADGGVDFDDIDAFVTLLSGG